MIGTSKYVKSIRIWSYSGPYLPAFGLDVARYGVSLRIQSECRKIRARITPNTDTFHAVSVVKVLRGNTYINQLISITHKIYKSLDDGYEVREHFLIYRKNFHLGLHCKLRRNSINGIR